MNTARLLEPILDNGIESVAFFNGRLVTAEDFEREHLAVSAHQRLLARSLGDGVAYGFDVHVAHTATEPILAIQAGLALSPGGDVVFLPDDIELSLVGQALNSLAPTSAGAGSFHQCSAASTGLYIAGRDAWLLTAFPAQGTRGRAPVTGLGNSTTACNAKYRVQGVQFRLVLLTNEFERALFDDGKEQALRSRIASRCFDVSSAANLARDPFGTRNSTRLVEVLRQRGVLTSCEVPLAVFLWQAKQGFAFVDRWAVRRRSAAPNSRDGWQDSFSDRERAEAEALLYQFQAQLDDISATHPEAVRARDYFEYLPPVGILPIAGNPQRSGFKLETFFDGFTLRPAGGSIPEGQPGIDAQTLIEGARMKSILRDAVRHSPFPSSSDEMIWIYQIRENIQAALIGASKVQPYVIFARAAVPYRGDAQFDFSRWGYASYS